MGLFYASSSQNAFSARPQNVRGLMPPQEFSEGDSNNDNDSDDGGNEGDVRGEESSIGIQSERSLSRATNALSARSDLHSEGAGPGVRPRTYDLWFQCDFFHPGPTQHKPFITTPESQKAPLKRNKQRLSRDVSPPLRADDKDGHYTFQIGDNLTHRYRIVSKMGEGTFGQVVECWDRKKEDNVAIKIVRGQPKYKEEAMIEIEMNQKISKSRRSHSRCVQMLDWFEYRNHVCIVFEKLGSSLYDCLKKNNYTPFPIDVVRDIGRQLLESVAYMHDLNLVHTDLKPENILFVSSKMENVRSEKESRESFKLPSSSTIKLIDFGSAEFDDKYYTSVVSTRHYRAPEVILGLGWNCCCDIWSVGCILAELAMGDTLFQTHKNLEHLAMMERVLGPLPYHMIRKTQRQKYIYHGKRLNWPEGALSSESINTVKHLPKLKDIISKHVINYAPDLVDLLYGLLEFDPSKRMRAAEALRHPFFRASKR